jgi:hypothetical protein
LALAKSQCCIGKISGYDCHNMPALRTVALHGAQRFNGVTNYFPHLLRKFLMADASELDRPISDERECACHDRFTNALVRRESCPRCIEIGGCDLLSIDPRFQVGSLFGLSLFIAQVLHFASP